MHHYYFTPLLLFVHSAMIIAADERIFLNPDIPGRIVLVGKSTFIECKTKGTNVQRVIWTGPDGTQITSYVDSVAPNTRENGIHVEDNDLGHRSAELHFRGIKRKDAGNYTCSAHVDGHDVSRSFILVVEKPPDFTNTASEQVLEEDTDSTLECNVEGFPEPTISWQKDDIYLSTTDMKYTMDKDRIVVNNVTRQDGGRYVCVARQVTNTSSNYEQFSINVIVHHKPMDTPVDTRGSVSYLNGVVNLTCDAVAEPKAKFTWTKDDEVISPSEDVSFFNEGNRSILQLTVSNQSMFGDYICIAKNNLGTLERVVLLVEGHKPAIPMAKVVDENPKSIKLSLSAPNLPKEPIEGFRIEYKLPGQDWSNASVKNFMAGQGNYILDGLKSDKLYVLRASSRNKAGFSDTTPDIHSRTQKEEISMNAGSHLVSSLLLLSVTLLFCSGSATGAVQVPLLSVKEM